MHEAHETATRILTERRADLDTLAKGLMEFETLTGDEIVGLLQGREAGARIAADQEPPPPRAAVPATGKPRSHRPGRRRPRAAAADLISPLSLRETAGAA